MEKREIFYIDGMHCSGCANTVANALVQADGVTNAHVNYESGTAEITHALSDDEIEHIIVSAGYQMKGKKTP